MAPNGVDPVTEALVDPDQMALFPADDQLELFGSDEPDAS